MNFQPLTSTIPHRLNHDFAGRLSYRFQWHCLIHYYEAFLPKPLSCIFIQETFSSCSSQRLTVGPTDGVMVMEFCAAIFLGV